MKKYFCLAGLAMSFLFCPSLFAQHINKAEYFFDTDPGIGNGTVIPVTTPADSVDITGSVSSNGLTAGFHRLMIRVRNVNGVWSLYEGRSFYIYPTVTTTNVQITNAEYFFDADPGVANGTAIATGAAADSIDVTSSVSTTGLSGGFHNLNIRVKNASGVWSLYETRSLYIIPAPVITLMHIVNAEYFFDTDPGIGNGNSITTGAPADSIDVTASISTTGLSAGFHGLFIRVQNQNGVWSLYEGRTFFISNPASSAVDQIVTAEYFFDADPGEGNGTAVTPSFSAADSIDINTSSAATSLLMGSHALYVRVKDQLGNWSLPLGDTFTVGYVGITTPIRISDIRILPNPSNGNFVFSYHLSTENSELQIRDVQGKLVFRQTISGSEGNQYVNVSDLSSGIFYWQIVSENQPAVNGKFAIVK